MNVVFDLGAVLIDWQPAKLLREHFPAHATNDVQAAQLARAFFHHEDWQAFDAGLRSVDEVVSRTAQRLNLPAQALHNLVAPLGEKLDPIPETVSLLRELYAHRAQRPDLRLFYLSNMPVPYARSLERRHDFFNCFDGGMFSGDVKRVKPHEEIYQLLAWHHGLEPSHTLFIDDAAPNVETARALGWRAIHCVSPSALPAQVWRHLELSA